MSHHTNEVPYCPLCSEKLAQCDSLLVDWFNWIKNLYPKVHVSWGWRNKADQDRMLEEGRTKAPWPQSRHNALDNEGRPSSQALDLFELKDDGTAQFPPELYEKIYRDTESLGLPIEWGGNFKSFKDRDHYQLNQGRIKNG